jgi:hypothetical protein
MIHHRITADTAKVTLVDAGTLRELGVRDGLIRRKGGCDLEVVDGAESKIIMGALLPPPRR